MRKSHGLWVLMVAIGGLLGGFWPTAVASAATYTVTNTNDTGTGSLRQAIQNANANFNTDTITFAIPGAGPHRITVHSSLRIFYPVIIDGYTQPGASPNTKAIGNNAVLLVEISGANEVDHGLEIFASNVTVRGLAINGFFNAGIQLIWNNLNVVIEGNFIGTSPSGTIARPNGTGIGLGLVWYGDGRCDAPVCGPRSTRIGGTSPAARNVISGNQYEGIFVSDETTESVVLGNYIGTDRQGTAPLPNNVGIWFGGGDRDPSYSNNIGDGTSAGANVISGNSGPGILVSKSFYLFADSNLIGVAADGVSARGNGDAGVIVVPPSVLETVGPVGSRMHIGLVSDETSDTDGFNIFKRNTIAYNASGVSVLTRGPTRLWENRIFSNNGPGIDLENDGIVEPNDAGDADEGPNDLQNYPVLTNVTRAAGNASVRISLDSSPFYWHVVEVFGNTTCDKSGHGEGQTFLYSTKVTGDPSRSTGVTFPLPAGINFLTATAAYAGRVGDDGFTDDGATSEFSQCVAVPPPTVSITGTVTRNGAPLSGALLTLSGSTSATALTGSNGTYAFTGLAAGGTYTVAPSLAGHVFTPTARTFPTQLLNAVADFTATQLLTISGRVTGLNNTNLVGVQISLSGSTNGSTTTGADGRYAFTDLVPGGSFTVLPTFAGVVFQPPTRTFTNLQADQVADFSQATIAITGTVLRNGAPLPGALLTLTGSTSATVLTGPNGTYALLGLAAGGTYTVTATLTGHVFSPLTRTFQAPTTNAIADFATNRLLTISGRAADLNDTGIAGVQLTLSGSQAARTVTNADGQYSFGGLAPGGSYTVTPDIPGFTFQPGSRVFNNLQEDQLADFARFVALTGVFRRYFAEGATGSFFDVSVALLNATETTAQVHLEFQKSDATVVTHDVAMPPLSRKTVMPEELTGLASAEFSTVVESNVPVIADRTMRWGRTGYGSHAETSIAAPALTWYLAEGATIGGFNLFYLLQNPNDAAAEVRVTYLLPSPQAPLVRTYSVSPRSRFNVWVNVEDPRLAAAEVSAVIDVLNGRPIIVERAMYRDGAGQVFRAGHASAGVTAPATTWHLAEGSTGAFFDLFVLIANPGATDAQVTATYLLPDGTTRTKDYLVSANSRFNIWVDLEELPAGSGQRPLANTGVSTTITSTNGVPIIVERAMWWPGTSETWFEGHNSPGATRSGTKWGLADGEVGGAASTETYILIANTSSTVGSVRVMLCFEDGTTMQRTFTVPPTSRFNVAVASDFPEATGKRFGAIVESLGSTPADIVVERAMYSNADGVTWAAGTNAVGTRLR